jgi:hypothetical protein
VRLSNLISSASKVSDDRLLLLERLAEAIIEGRGSNEVVEIAKTSAELPHDTETVDRAESSSRSDLEGKGIGEILDRKSVQHRLTREVVDDESTEWADSVLLGVVDAAERLGITRSTLDNWRRSHKALAFSHGLRNFVFPMEQFARAKPLAGLDSVRSHFPSDEDAWEWLVTPNHWTRDQKPLNWLREGFVEEVVRAAEGVLDFA